MELKGISSDGEELIQVGETMAEVDMESISSFFTLSGKSLNPSLIIKYAVFIFLIVITVGSSLFCSREQFCTGTDVKLRPGYDDKSASFDYALNNTEDVDGIVTLYMTTSLTESIRGYIHNYQAISTVNEFSDNFNSRGMNYDTKTILEVNPKSLRTEQIQVFKHKVFHPINISGSLTLQTPFPNTNGFSLKACMPNIALNQRQAIISNVTTVIMVFTLILFFYTLKGEMNTQQTYAALILFTSIFSSNLVIKSLIKVGPLASMVTKLFHMANIFIFRFASIHLQMTDDNSATKSIKNLISVIMISILSFIDLVKEFVIKFNLPISICSEGQLCRAYAVAYSVYGLAFTNFCYTRLITAKSSDLINAISNLVAFAPLILSGFYTDVMLVLGKLQNLPSRDMIMGDTIEEFSALFFAYFSMGLVQD